MNLSNLSIKFKLFFIAILSVLGLCLIEATVANSISGIGLLQGSRTQLSDLESTMLALRRHEKDFLMRVDDKYVERFNDTLKQSKQQLQLFIKTLTGVGIETATLNQMGGLLNNYGDRFNAVAVLQQQIGYDPKSGLYGDLRRSVHTIEEQLADDPELKISMLTLRRHEKDFMLRQDLKYIDRFNQEIKHFTALAVKTLGNSQSETIMSLATDYSTRFSQLTDATKEMGLDANSGVIGEMRENAHQMEKIFDTLKKDLNTNITNKVTASRSFLISILIVVGIVIVGGTVVTALSIFKPLALFTEEITRVIDSKDLTVKLSVNGNNEISGVARAFNSLLLVLYEMIENINNASIQVASSAKEISITTQEVTHVSETQNSEVEHAAVAVNEISATVQEIARNASTAADSVIEVHKQLKEGVIVADEARQEIQALSDEVQNAVSAIKDLENNSKNIGQVLDAIQNVAEQTNLLALNAAIEAARAGEQGRGFAVVADEVRTLAQRTQESTETIRQTITEFQQGTNQVVTAVSCSNQRSESGIARVTRSVEILNEIALMIEAISDMNIQIASAAEQQGATAEEVSRNVVRVSELSRAVTGQIEQASQSSAELSALGESQQGIAKAFKL